MIICCLDNFRFVELKTSQLMILSFKPFVLVTTAKALKTA